MAIASCNWCAPDPNGRSAADQCRAVDHAIAPVVPASVPVVTIRGKISDHADTKHASRDMHIEELP
jgi:hypothetical protein